MHCILVVMNFVNMLSASAGCSHVEYKLAQNCVSSQTNMVYANGYYLTQLCSVTILI